MTNLQLKSRIAELEAEVARLKAQVEELTPKRDWWNHIGSTPPTPAERRADELFDRCMRQIRYADRELPRSPGLTWLRQEHRVVIVKLRKLAGFKSNGAAAQYAQQKFVY
jgi:hypothetical protein